MGHRLVETDLAHLERVVARVSLGDRIPLSYWRKRVDAVLEVACEPSQLARAKKLIGVLNALKPIPK